MRAHKEEILSFFKQSGRNCYECQVVEQVLAGGGNWKEVILDVVYVQEMGHISSFDAFYCKQQHVSPSYSRLTREVCVKMQYIAPVLFYSYSFQIFRYSLS